MPWLKQLLKDFLNKIHICDATTVLNCIHFSNILFKKLINLEAKIFLMSFLLWMEKKWFIILINSALISKFINPTLSLSS